MGLGRGRGWGVGVWGLGVRQHFKTYVPQIKKHQLDILVQKKSRSRVEGCVGLIDHSAMPNFIMLGFNGFGDN